MHRRAFLAGLSAAFVPGIAAAYPSVPYVEATWPDLRDTTDKIVLNWRASWSLTCQIKHELITNLITTNPDYAQLTFVDVDWDTFGPSVWAQRLKVKRRSTLIAVRGKQEITRIVNEPYERQIKRFLDEALAA